MTSIRPLVRKLCIRLSNKYNEYTTTNNKTLSLQQIHMARTTYDVITHNNLTNFAHVLSHILSYIGLIKCEKEPPRNIDVANMLRFLHQFVETGCLSNFHINVLTVLLSKPNERLKRYHSLRVNLLHCCFVHEMRRLRITEGEVNHVTVCFVKITEYFVHFDMVLSSKLVDDYLITNLVSEIVMTGFVENIHLLS